MEDGLIYPTIKGIAYVKWKEYATGTVRYISELLATGEAGKRLHKIRIEKGKSLTSEDIPVDIKLVPFEEGGINPYVFCSSFLRRAEYAFPLILRVPYASHF